MALNERNGADGGRWIALAALSVAYALLTIEAAGAQAFGAFGLRDYSGEELFQQFCSSCHGESGRGDGVVAGSLNVLVPDLTRLRERNDGEFPVTDVRDVIDGRALVVAHGERRMPVWGYEFWVEEGADAPAERDAREIINRLVRYVESIQQDRDPGVSPR